MDLSALINIARDILEEGLVYAILALGVYITYTILDFPDLSVDGTMPLGGILSGVLIFKGVDPWLSLVAAFAAGAAAGSITGILNVKLKIRPLLCGILVMTSLLSINIVLAQFAANSSLVSFYDKDTIFTGGAATLIPERFGDYRFRGVIIAAVIVIIAKIIMDLYFSTKSGLLLRATGSNSQFVTMLAKDSGNVKILGLSLGNGFAALAGAIIAQQRFSADSQMGVGMVVIGLASVIIGTSLFKRVKFMKATTMVILGSILYKACLSLALALGLPTNYLKLLMAVIFTIALVSSRILTKGRGLIND